MTVEDSRLSLLGAIVFLNEHPSTRRTKSKWFKLFFFRLVFYQDCFLLDGVANPITNPPFLFGLETGSNPKRATGEEIVVLYYRVDQGTMSLNTGTNY